MAGLAGDLVGVPVVGAGVWEEQLCRSLPLQMKSVARRERSGEARERRAGQSRGFCVRRDHRWGRRKRRRRTAWARLRGDRGCRAHGEELDIGHERRVALHWGGGPAHNPGFTRLVFTEVADRCVVAEPMRKPDVELCVL